MPRFPRRSREIRLGLLLAVAASLAACERRRCLDGTDAVVPDENCRELAPSATQRSAGYHWYYYGNRYYGRSWSSFGSSYGSHSSSSSSSVSRGGFGHSASAHSSGGS